MKATPLCNFCNKMRVIAYGKEGFSYICPHCKISGDQERPSSYIEFPIEEYTFKSLNDYADIDYRSVTK